MSADTGRRAPLTTLQDSDHMRAATIAKRRTPWWLALVVAFVIFILGAILAVVHLNMPRNPSALVTALFFVPTLIVAYGVRIVLIGLWVGKYERRPFRTLGFPAGDATLLLRGLAVGLLVSGSIVGVIAAFGGVTVQQAPAGATGLAAVGGAIVMFVGWSVQSSAEEIMYRGFLQQALGRWRAWLGVVLTAILFMVAHESALSNPLAAINIFLAGVMFGLYVLREGGLWGACGLHIVFNWAQNSLFGFSVSGQQVPGGSLLALQTRGSTLISGGDFGIEAGLAGTAVLTAVIVVLLFMRNRRVSSLPSSSPAPAHSSPA